jgi:OOP family OmpA-OmpF porin
MCDIEMVFAEVSMMIRLAALGAGAVLCMAAAPTPAPPRAAAPPALARGALPSGDAPGARDAAILPRYAGAILLESKASAFDDITLPNAKLERQGDQRDSSNNRLNRPPEPLAVEGRLTRMTYLLPQGRSSLEVVRGYQQTIKDGGGSVLFECSGDGCGGSPTSGATSGGSETGLIHMLYPKAMVSGNWTMCPLDEGMAGQRYTLLDLPQGAGKAVVLTWSVGDVSAGSDCHAWVGRVVALVVTVETAAREQRMETVNAASVEQSLARDGRVALYSILFDTGRAEIKPESQPQVTELVSFMRSAPATKVLVVGHTDNQGALDYNLDLSRRRAQAVTAALAAQGIPAARMVPQGVGMAAPLASNDTDDGRAKNRRVELVKQ